MSSKMADVSHEETIDIPLRQHGEVLEVSRRELKGNQEFVFNILNDEVAALWVFLDVGLEYYKQGHLLEFEQAIRSGIYRAQQERNPKEQPHQLLLLNVLASFYIELAKTTPADGRYVTHKSNNLTKEDCLLEATALLNEARKMDPQDTFAIVASGNILLARHRHDEALEAFAAALRRDPNCVPALLGEGAVRSASGDHKTALQRYQRVLQLQPDMRPDVRVAIGICYYNLGAMIQARKAFERALAVDPNNPDALTLLSIIDWNGLRSTTDGTKVEKDAIVARANERLLLVYKNESKHPLFSCQMAQRKLITQSYGDAIEYADRVVHHSNNPKLRAEALVCKGKALKAQGDSDAALQCFEQANALNPGSRSAQYSLGMLYVQKGDAEKGVRCLEAILSKEPNNVEVIVRLAYLYAQSPKHRTQAVELFDRANKQSGGLLDSVNGVNGIAAESKSSGTIEDPLVWLEIAKVMEHTNMKRSLQLNLKAIKRLTQQGSPVPPEVYNNIGSLCHVTSQRMSATAKGPILPGLQRPAAAHIPVEDGQSAFDRPPIDMFAAIGHIDDVLKREEFWTRENLLRLAEDFYFLALQACQQEIGRGNVSEDAPLTVVTVRYNLARVQESMGETSRAEDMYQELLRDQPGYSEAYNRLGIIAMNEGRHNDAVEHFRLLSEADPKQPEPRLYMGKAYLAADNKNNAKRAFDSVLKYIDNQNIQALVALAHVQLGLARSARHNPKERDEWIQRAHRLYDAALKADKKNVPAAVGMGIILAEVGMLEDALAIFRQVEQATGNLPAVAMDLAHVILAQDEKDAKSAIPMYEKALKKGNENDAYVLQALARAYYILARERKDEAAMQVSLRYIEQAARVEPSDTACLFNVALVKQQMAVVLNDLPIERRNLAAMHRALQGIDTAERIFGALANRAPESRPNYNIAHASHRKAYCKDVRKLSEKKIHETTTLERQREERKERIREEQKAREEEKRRREHEESEKRRLQEEERAKQRAEVQARVQSDLQRAQQYAEEEREREEASGGGKRRGANKRDRERDVSPESAGEEREPVEKRKKLRKKPSSTKSRDSDTSTDKKPRGTGSRGRPRGVQSQLSAEFVSDSSDEDTVGRTNGDNGHESAAENGRNDGRSHSPSPAAAAGVTDGDESPHGEKRRRSEEDDGAEANGHGDEEDEDEVRVRPRLSKIRRTAVADSDEEDVREEAPAAEGEREEAAA
ncbi:uncharacterized protein EV422DRAFT_565249 [Fimicolochytrium jonesii]|uniref:uncharacterized protein n=1 Tax=Fimicolochytrium jonesii TaxID=1396493 RepID=UPI0022FF24D7|nr:uncharacterized protein EV422DRAFT_565249 [Fimicolochytrium jonesii]KAI8824560.1 hypothetical protein EV422DRAFT_565249 [Fimicolochytrium jonesii]